MVFRLVCVCWIYLIKEYMVLEILIIVVIKVRLFLLMVRGFIVL